MVETSPGLFTEESFQGLEPGQRVLVAVSGGLDSVVLAHLLHKKNWPIEIAHVNYGLRAQASDLDEQVVRDLGISLKVPVWVLDAKHLQKPNHSIQKWARDIRYDWFTTCCVSHGIDVVAVAHHADDQLETVLLNVLRGGELAGLSGMQQSRKLESGIELVRPLLLSAQKDLRRYAIKKELVWREDASNANKKYLRNGIRAELREMAEPEYEAFRRAGINVVARLSAVRTSIRAILDTAVVRHPGSVLQFELSLADWKSIPPVFQGLVLLDLIAYLDPSAPRRSSSVNRLLALWEGPVGKRVQLGQIAVWKERGGLLFGKKKQSEITSNNQNPVWKVNSDLHIDEKAPFSVKIRPKSSSLLVGLSSNQAVLDFTKISFPLFIRPWKPGDSFQPLGMNGRQKVKKFLTNRKISSHLKEDVLVVESNGDIIWVVGHQIDHRFRVTDATLETLFITWEGSSA